MKKLNTIFLTLLAIMIVSMHSMAQSSNQVTEYLHLPGPVTLLNNTYLLAWSSHPSDNYYKQEYIPAGDPLDKFHKMVMVDVLTGSATPSQLAAAKIEELKTLKTTNPVVNYQVYQKDQAILLDFLVSENAADGNSILILERNVYRYVPYKDNAGNTGVLLFACAERAYANEVMPYLTNLKGKREELLNAVGNYQLPAIAIK
ncbi:hypothetical protein DCM91_00930 [Chitinophaga costaii]|nr:hypothetical protein DCM91_00930 [Chitinophaga costaii]